ncbi:hypothetical protein H0H92_009033 [Tricholoma furcatifolium]|nr:hypothetical protein H0H92_009033 [Tricholoma furcatifolium]
MVQDLPPPVLPPLDRDGQLLLPDALEFNWKHNPKQPFYTYADPQAVDGVQVITHLEFGRAAHRAAHLVRPRAQQQSTTGESDREIVMVIADSDVVLVQAVHAGMMVAGLVPFVVSLLLPPSLVAELIAKTSCRRVLATDSVHIRARVAEIKAHLETLGHALDVDEMPSLEAVYPYLAHEDVDHPFEPYRFPGRRSATDVCTVVHSSGTTGSPKIIAQTYQCWIDSVRCPEFRNHSPRVRCGSMGVPPVYGVGVQLFQPVYSLVVASVFPPTLTGTPKHVPTPQSILEHAKATKTNVLLSVPILLEIWSRSAEAVEYLKELEYIGYGQSSLKPKVGNQLTAAGVRLSNAYAAAEFIVPVSTVPNGVAWDYVRFLDTVKVRWNPLGDGVFECHLLKCETHHPNVLNLPDVEGYATGDMFVRHPTDEGLWKPVGRLSEVIVHSSGRKTVPGPMEDIIAGDPIVDAAMLVGHGHDRTGVVIQLKPEIEDAEDLEHATISRLRDQIWDNRPTVEEANNVAMDFSRLSKEMIIFTSKGKPLPLTRKVTVKRSLALEIYASEISELFRRV